MPGLRERGEKIRDFITKNTRKPHLVATVAAKFGISKPAVYKHINFLIDIGIIARTDDGYRNELNSFNYIYKIDRTLSEDVVWERDIKKHFTPLSENIRRIWMYGFLEMFNNAIDHSGAKKIFVNIMQVPNAIYLSVRDDGIGIFKNIKNKLKLNSLDDALLELSKGKTTTDKARHSGEGIFFTSKMFDVFEIHANGIRFATQNISDFEKPNKTVIDKNNTTGTLVSMFLQNNSRRTTKEVFDKFSDKKTFGFTKTIVPIRLAATDDLISRSQARRVLSRLELFNEIILDFKDVKSIGQAFADEIFRVFQAAHPKIKIYETNVNKDIKNMISRAKNVRL